MKILDKRILEYNKNNRYFIYIIKPLIKYFEDFSIEDLQINEMEKITLIKRKGEKEFIEDSNINEQFIKNIMFYIGSLAGQSFIRGDTQISCMLPVNRFRFSGRADRSIDSGVKISIRLNDGVLYHSYEDFNLTELEFNFLVKHICELKSSCFVIGETGSGKTTFNNLLIDKISNNEIINVAGDINELIFRKEQNVSEITVRNEDEYQKTFDLLMRSNPERIIIPELTTNNANLILRSMNTGTKGFMITLHAGSNDKSVAEAFEGNLKLSKQESIPVDELSKKINSYVDFFIYLNKNENGERYINKIVINNKEIEEEAKELGILGYNKEAIKNKIIQKKSKRQISIKKIAKEYKKGKSVRNIAKEYKMSKNTIYEAIKDLKSVIQGK